MFDIEGDTESLTSPFSINCDTSVTRSQKTFFRLESWEWESRGEKSDPRQKWMEEVAERARFRGAIDSTRLICINFSRRMSDQKQENRLCLSLTHSLARSLANPIG
jgi:hypothetical protein